MPMLLTDSSLKVWFRVCVREPYRRVDFLEQLLVLLLFLHAGEALRPQLRVQVEVLAEPQPLSCAQGFVVVFVAVEGSAYFCHFLLLRVEYEYFFKGLLPAAFSLLQPVLRLPLRLVQLVDLLLQEAYGVSQGGLDLRVFRLLELRLVLFEGLAERVFRVVRSDGARLEILVAQVAGLDQVEEGRPEEIERHRDFWFVGVQLAVDSEVAEEVSFELFGEELRAVVSSQLDVCRLGVFPHELQAALFGEEVEEQPAVVFEGDVVPDVWVPPSLESRDKVAPVLRDEVIDYGSHLTVPLRTLVRGGVHHAERVVHLEHSFQIVIGKAPA